MDSHSKRSAQDASSKDEVIKDDKAIKEDGVIKLRLYVAGHSPNSTRAFQNLRTICNALLKEDDWDLEVVDILEYPLRAVEDKILVTPTLLKLNPPVVRLIGDLSERQAVLDALNIGVK